MNTHVIVTGYLLMALAVIHIIFPRYFNWRKELKQVSLVNRQIMYIHTLFIALTVFLMGALCVNASEELVNTPLGNKICLGLCAFWSTRFVIQFIGYSSKLWRGKPFETTIHILFACTWAYISGVFLVICWNVYGR